MNILTQKNHLVKAALWYAQKKGWAVFPVYSVDENGVCTCYKREKCGNPGKHPRYDKELLPNGRNGASTDPQKIREWWETWPDSNVGIATGPESGLVVLDIDTDKGGETTLEEFIREYGPLPETVESITGSGGRHILFKHPGWYIKSTAGEIGDGVDIRGDGGYIVVPPSNHVSGRRYEWEIEHRPEDTDLADLPEWLADKLKKKVDRSSQEAKATTTGRVWRRYLQGGPIREGTRDNTLFSIGCAMRAQGASHADILATLLKINEQRCKPPMDYRTVLQKADQAAKYSPGKNGLLSFPPSDLGNAERLVDRHGADLKFCAPLGGWFVWDGKRWARDTSGEIFRRAAETVRAYRREAENMLKEITDKLATAIPHERIQLENELKTAEAVVKFARQSESKPRLEAMVVLAQFQPGIPIEADQMDQDRYLLNVNNGTIELKTGRIREHRREDLITKLAPVDYDPSAKAPRWEQFLDEIMAGDTGMINYLKRKVGYCLSGDTSEEDLDILYGSGGNGKSKFLEAIQNLLGDYAQQAPTSLLLKKANNNGPSPEVARLRGARFVSTVETGEGKRMDEELVKQLTGRDKVTARHLYKEFIEFVPEAKIFLATNHKPVVRGDDGGIWRRLRLVPFEVTIPEEKRDPKLPEKLLAELPGILNWALEGFREWDQNGLKPPAKILAATKVYQSEMDKIGEFLEECCVTNPLAKVSVKDLFNSYKTWAFEAGIKPLSKQRFNQKIEERGFYKEKGTYGQLYWHGIGLMDSSVEKVEKVEGSQQTSINERGAKSFVQSYEKTSTFSTKSTQEDPWDVEVAVSLEEGEI